MPVNLLAICHSLTLTAVFYKKFTPLVIDEASSVTYNFVATGIWGSAGIGRQA